MELSEADDVWNRACLENGGTNPRAGDRALADLLLFDGLVANGGLGHGFDVCSKSETQAAIDGFRYFGLTETADFLTKAEWYSEEVQESLSPRYYEYSEKILDTFTKFYSENPEAFAPLNVNPR